MIEFNTHPDQYQHWTIDFDCPIATLKLKVNEDGGLHAGYKLKLNSYDLGVDIECMMQSAFTLRTSGNKSYCSYFSNGNVFCAGANIKMLGFLLMHIK
ncbi:MAG: hypothetical protein Ct9H300mP21_00280 [Pseudomonadota bacterium]|nr:MAG: hypothetical protein Ct9H300mP21_00280 [Pseudomonadota bacterium]